MSTINKKTLDNDTISITDTTVINDFTVSSIGAIGSGFDFTTLGNVTIGSNGTSATDWTTGSLNTVWTVPTTGTGYNWNTITAPSTEISQSGKMSLRGEQADIDINGKSLKNWMEKVEERLNILTPNPELEKEWDELRKLGERYRKLEKKCKEKAEVWKKLKAMPPPDLG